MSGLGFFVAFYRHCAWGDDGGSGDEPSPFFSRIGHPPGRDNCGSNPDFVTGLGWESRILRRSQCERRFESSRAVLDSGNGGKRFSRGRSDQSNGDGKPRGRLFRNAQRGLPSCCGAVR